MQTTNMTMGFSNTGHHPVSNTSTSNHLRPTRILVQYSDPLIHAGLQATLQGQFGFELLPSVPRGGGADTPYSDTGADVVVADYEQGLALIGSTRFPGLPTVQGRGRAPNVLIVTQRESEWEIRNALELGVRGYLVLGCRLEELVDAVRTLHLGMRHIGSVAARRLADSVACVDLTSRETAVLRLVAQGQSNKAVARELDIAIGTVKTHLKAIFEKLRASSRTEVATVAEKRGLLTQPLVFTAGSVSRTPVPRAVERERSPLFAASAVH